MFAAFPIPAESCAVVIRGAGQKRDVSHLLQIAGGPLLAIRSN
jgi:hypothetical protein